MAMRFPCPKCGRNTDKFIGYYRGELVYECMWKDCRQRYVWPMGTLLTCEMVSATREESMRAGGQRQ